MTIIAVSKPLLLSPSNASVPLSLIIVLKCHFNHLVPSLKMSQGTLLPNTHVYVEVVAKGGMSVLSPVRLFATPRPAAHQAPPSVGFSRQDYWSGLLLILPHPRDLPALEIEPVAPASPTFPADSTRQAIRQAQLKWVLTIKSNQLVYEGDNSGGDKWSVEACTSQVIHPGLCISFLYLVKVCLEAALRRGGCGRCQERETCKTRCVFRRGKKSWTQA